MKTNAASWVCAVLCLLATVAAADEPVSVDPLQQAAHAAVYGCSRSTGTYVTLLRDAGPVGLEALFALRAEMVKNAPRPDDPKTTQDYPTTDAVKDHAYRMQRLTTAIDAVGGQRDCSASRLYWHTDIESAKAAALASGKPILSLRMLGKLTDDLSCANSRFFRTALYANQEIAEVLRTRYILHWKSVRPVPTVTIDFGDGRKLVRTVTGNSIHYILDPHGRVVDALPGLYGPKAFLRQLAEAEAFLRTAPAGQSGEWQAALARWHTIRQAQAVAAWQADMEVLGIATSGAAEATTPERAFKALLASTRQPQAQQQQAAAREANPPRAAAAAVIARPKNSLERPIIALVSPADTRLLESRTSDEQWEKIAALHAEDGELDAASRALIDAKTPTAARAGELAITKAKVELPLARMVRAFQQSIALDTVRNEYQLHRQIHEWLAAAPVVEVDVLNERVYAELFLTPSSDPWLGLLPGDTYSALDNGGVVQK